MTEACDPDADIETLRKAIKMQTGEDLKLTRKQMCDAYNNISGGKLPLPPLVMTADRTYLVDRASPLKHLEYELLFDSATKRNDLKRIARKVGLTSQIEQMTKKQLVDAIGKRLRYMKIREPIKIVTKRLITKDVSNAVNNAAVNNTAVRNNTAVNNTAVNNNRRNFNNNSAFNNTENRNSNFNNFNANKKNGFNNNNRGNNNFGNNRRNNNNSVNLSGNRNGLKFKVNQSTGTTSLNFPNKLKFKSSFVASKTNTGSQTNAGTRITSMSTGTGTNSGTQTSFNRTITPTGNKQKPAFLTASTSTSTSTNAGPPPTQFSNAFKAKPSFLAGGPPAPGKNAINAKQSSFANSMATKSANAAANKEAAVNGPKKPGMFNWMFKKKNAAAAGAAGAAAGAAAAANGPKKCGMMNRLMGRCKKNGTVAIKTEPNAATNNGKPVVNPYAATNSANKAGPNANKNGPKNNKANNNANKNGPRIVWPGENGYNNAPRQPEIYMEQSGNEDVKIVANQILNEINKDVVAGVNNASAEINKQMALRTNGLNNRKLSKNNKALVASVTGGIINNIVRKDITKRINSRNLVAVSNKKNLNGNAELRNMNLKINNLNNANKNLILSIKKATTPKEVRKIFLKGAPKLHPNHGGNTNFFRMFREAYKKKLDELLEAGNTKSTVNYVANGIMKEINRDVIKQISNGSKSSKILAIANKPKNNGFNANNEFNRQMALRTTSEPSKADIEYVANQILNKLQNDVQNEISTHPIYNTNSNSNNNMNNKKTTRNNPLFEPNMKINPVYNNNANSNNNKSNNNAKPNNNKNSFNGGLRLGANNNNVSIPRSTNIVNVNNVNINVNDLPNEVEKQENNVRNMIKNFNTERKKLENKITKELNLIPNNNGVFKERTGITKGKIGLWARELRRAETLEDLKAIENKLNEKIVLRRNIENKYTKAGLTKVEKMNHRRKVVKWLNNATSRRKEIEMQVKNKQSNNNKNSVISNYNSNANNNPNRAKKMKYKSRENFVEAKKVELRELAKKTSTNFGRNINRMQTRQDVFKLRGRIKGAIRRDEGLSKLAKN